MSEDTTETEVLSEMLGDCQALLVKACAERDGALRVVERLDVALSKALEVRHDAIEMIEELLKAWGGPGGAEYDRRLRELKERR